MKLIQTKNQTFFFCATAMQLNAFNLDHKLCFCATEVVQETVSRVFNLTECPENHLIRFFFYSFKCPTFIWLSVKASAK